MASSPIPSTASCVLLFSLQTSTNALRAHTHAYRQRSAWMPTPAAAPTTIVSAPLAPSTPMASAATVRCHDKRVSARDSQPSSHPHPNLFSADLKQTRAHRRPSRRPPPPSPSTSLPTRIPNTRYAAAAGYCCCSFCPRRNSSCPLSSQVYIAQWLLDGSEATPLPSYNPYTLTSSSLTASGLQAGRYFQVRL